MPIERVREVPRSPTPTYLDGTPAITTPVPAKFKPVVKKFGGVAAGVGLTLIAIYGISWIKEVWPKPTPAAAAIAKSMDEHPERWTMTGNSMSTSIGEESISVSSVNYTSYITVNVGYRELTGFESGWNWGSANQREVGRAVKRWQKHQKKLANIGQLPADRAVVKALEGN